jgi:hypothetical protein
MITEDLAPWGVYPKSEMSDQASSPRQLIIEWGSALKRGAAVIAPRAQ